MAEQSKEAKIRKEKNRLLKIFKEIDENKLATVRALIDRAAFITVSLAEIEEELNKNGWTEEYQNGENQRGIKRAANADLHISLTKNLNAIIKQLVELVPEGQKADSKLKAMMLG